MKIAVMILTGLLLTGCVASLPEPGRSYRCPVPFGIAQKYWSRASDRARAYVARSGRQTPTSM